MFCSEGEGISVSSFESSHLKMSSFISQKKKKKKKLVLIRITDDPNWEVLHKSVKMERLETLGRKSQNEMQR